MGGTLGRTGLAQFLSGSKISWLESFSNHSYYARLSHLSQKAILNIIDALITDGKLQTTGGGRPKVILPNQPPHQNPAQPLTAIKVDAPPPNQENQPTLPPSALSPDSPPNLPKRSVSPHPPTSPSPNLPSPNPPISSAPLLEALRTWRTEQAKSQQVPPYIILSNKVLESIAAQQPSTLTQVSQISGIGPAKLEQYGQAVLDLVLGTASPTADNPPQKPELDTLPQIKNEPSPATPPQQTLTPLEAVLTVVSDLDGLLTIAGLAQLLTAGPNEIVSFSDHELFGLFHGNLATDDLTAQIQGILQNGDLLLSPHQRLTPPAGL